MTAREIPLSRGLVAIVDEADYEWLSQWKWSASRQGRAGCIEPKWRAVRVEQRAGKQRTILMHRVISGAGEGETVDHDNGNSLDNTRRNLIVTTQRANSVNRVGWRMPTSSAFKGVFWHRGGRKWMASFRGTYLGLHATEREAAIAYNQAASMSSDRVPLNIVEER